MVKIWGFRKTTRGNLDFIYWIAYQFSLFKIFLPLLSVFFKTSLSPNDDMTSLLIFLISLKFNIILCTEWNALPDIKWTLLETTFNTSNILKHFIRYVHYLHIQIWNFYRRSTKFLPRNFEIRTERTITTTTTKWTPTATPVAAKTT